MTVNDPAGVRAQYADSGRLQTRAAVWQADPAEGSPKDAALAAVIGAAPAQVLEIGCGTGEFAAQVAARLPGAEVVATDQSPAMADEARRRGVTTQIVEASRLPWPDGSFDVVVALWMLYHVPDLPATLAQVRRVLRPGGLFVAATNGRDHTADLRALAGLSPAVTQFMTENAEDALAPHFTDVTVQHFSSTAVLDHAGAQSYIATFAPDAAATITHFDGERTFRGRSSVITATA